MNQGILAVIFVAFFGFALVAAAVPVVSTLGENIFEGAQTDPLGCTTGASDTTCGVTLTAQHIHFDTSGITITETSPGSGTRTGTLNTQDRVTLTVTGLTAATTYTFDIAYQPRATNVSSGLADFIKVTPILMVLTVFVAMPVLIVLAFYVLKRRMTGLFR